MEILSELIAWLKAVSPAVWGIYVRQAYVNAAGRLVWCILAAAGAVALSYLSRYASRRYEALGNGGPRSTIAQDESSWDVGAAVSAAFAALAVLLSAYQLVGALMMFVNPEYYAIQLILTAIGR